MLQTFRKVKLAFSSAHCDFPTMLWGASRLLRTLSLNVDPRNMERIPIIVIILNVIVTSSYYYVYLVSMVWFVFWKCMQTREVLLALIVFSLGVSSEMGPVKLFFMFLHKDTLRQMVTQCLALDMVEDPGSRFSTNLKKTLRYVKNRATIFWSIIMANGLIYIMKPIVLPGRHLMEDFFILYGLEPMFESPNYEIAFITTSMGVFFSAYIPSNTTVFQIIIGGYIEAQMLAWSQELTNLWKDAEDYYLNHKSLNPTANLKGENEYKEKNRVLNEFVNQRLKIIIRAHATNINLLSMLKVIYSEAIAIEFAILIVCLIAELLGGLENTYLEVPFALMQVGVDCFIGQRVLDASLVFERAVYDCQWENFDNGNMKVVMTMMIIAKKPMILSAASITKLDFVSFLSIIKFVYSGYTTLRATVK